MKRGRNKKQILIAVIVAIAALIICSIATSLLPASISRFKGIIFWILFLAIAVPGVYFVGKSDRF